MGGPRAKPKREAQTARRGESRGPLAVFKTIQTSSDWTRPEVRLQPRWLQPVAAILLYEPMHWIMQMRQFANLKRRAEAAVGSHV